MARVSGLDVTIGSVLQPGRKEIRLAPSVSCATHAIRIFLPSVGLEIGISFGREVELDESSPVIALFSGTAEAEYAAVSADVSIKSEDGR